LDQRRLPQARGAERAAAELSVGMLRQEAAGDPVGLALYVVMDALTPAERVSFILHDVFEIPFDTIAGILDRSAAATKMLASRARGRLRLGAPAAGAHAAARASLSPSAGGRSRSWRSRSRTVPSRRSAR